MPRGLIFGVRDPWPKIRNPFLRFLTFWFWPFYAKISTFLKFYSIYFEKFYMESYDIETWNVVCTLFAGILICFHSRFNLFCILLSVLENIISLSFPEAVFGLGYWFSHERSMVKNVDRFWHFDFWPTYAIFPIIFLGLNKIGKPWKLHFKGKGADFFLDERPLIKYPEGFFSRCLKFRFFTYVAKLSIFRIYYVYCL